MRKSILAKPVGWFAKYLGSFALGMWAALLPAVIPRTEAQALTTLYNFNFANGGYMPISDLALSGNTLYGTTKVGNGSGTVFKINTDGSGYTLLHSFTNINDGEFPYAGVIVSGDTLYGTTETGGPAGTGTIFSLSTNGTNFTVVYDFSGDTDGANPVAPLILSNGVLYGTTQNGGCNGKGTVFAVNTDGTGYTNLYCFDIGPDGYNPVAGLVLSGNTLYGTAGYGSSGSSGSPFGTVFKVNTDSSGFATLHRFTAAGDDGANPLAALVLSGNTLYGTTEFGGLYGNGTVFKIDTDGTNYLTLYDFPTPTQGYDPTGVLALNGDTLYGTTQEGLSSYGMVFQLSTNGGAIAPLHIFTNGNDGGNPYAGALLSGTTLYGTTSQGGSTGSGVVFALSLGSTPPPLAVSARMSPGGLVLNWSDSSFTLQAAADLTGPFTNVPSATSPYTNSLFAAQGFFRLSRP